MIDIEAPSMDAAGTRLAGKDILSLAFMDSRNRSLRWVASCEELLAHTRWGLGPMAQALPWCDPPLWVLGHLGWFQEFWVSRNLQRQRGEPLHVDAARLASIDPTTELYLDPRRLPREAKWNAEPPDLDAVRQYLAATLDSTLELLERAHEDDAGLHCFRLALLHEDTCGEALAVRSQTLGLALPYMPDIVDLPQREPLLFAATRGQLGVAGPGFVFERERPAHDEHTPEFEIDAQAVSWAQYAEFVEDGGYDDAQWWSAEGWAWVQALGRRVPRHVEQLRHGVLLQRFGATVRVSMGQAAQHLSWYEADAWCRWAGRRLPTELEWELAARSGRARGFVWGQVWEWTLNRYRPYPGGVLADPLGGTAPCWAQPADGSHRVLRGASFATHERLRHPQFRRALLPERDDAFTGFRSCAL